MLVGLTSWAPGKRGRDLLLWWDSRRFGQRGKPKESQRSLIVVDLPQLHLGDVLYWNMRQTNHSLRTRKHVRKNVED